MAYPLIIFGAGASHDYSHLGLGSRCPLTDHLAKDNQFLFADLVNKYKGVGGLLSDVIQQVRKKQRSFEDVLTELSGQADVPTKKQLVALHFYLRDLFERLSSDANTDTTIQRDVLRMHSANNYQVIINRVHTYSESKACIVSFNYDTLFERNLPGGGPKTMRDYISGDLKIIKPHGSHDWSYIYRKSELKKNGWQGEDSFKWSFNTPGFLNEFWDSEPYHNAEVNSETHEAEFMKFPAIALPLVGKDKYVAPKAHILALERILPGVDRILIIGWKAGDPELLTILEKHLQKMAYKVLVVSGTQKGAEAVAANIGRALSIGPDYISVHGGGFSTFTADEIGRTFFQ